MDAVTVWSEVTPASAPLSRLIPVAPETTFPVTLNVSPSVTVKVASPLVIEVSELKPLKSTEVSSSMVTAAGFVSSAVSVRVVESPSPSTL